MEYDYLKHVSNIEIQNLREIMEQYGEDVWNYAYFLTKKHDMANDISQEVFIKVYRSIGSFQGNSSLKTWLLKITRNTSFSYLNLAFIRKVTLVGFFIPQGTSPSAEKQFFEQHISNEAWNIVMKLSAKHREVLILNAYHQLSLEEIASTLGITVGTVKSRLHRAKAKASELLKEGKLND
jgi:RNA polymerase sigma-70 factor, ECF subfamily